jgi:CO dehydrogenase/acetyl-CoA synthase gamma subunit (corrinoid Fe-S protein)
MVVTVNKKHAKGRIDVKTYEPKPYEERKDGPDLVEIHVSETFSGDIEGDGVVRFLQAVREDGSASFVGIERVSGQIGERKGSFLLQDAGTLVNNIVKGEWFVIPGSGTDELEGLRGDGGFTALVGEQASITLDYWFEETEPDR